MDYLKEEDGTWTKYIGGAMTQPYQVWYSMTQRCIPGGRIQMLYPTYQGCHMSDEFADFQRFADWYAQQPGFNVVNYDLDKDLLYPNNKLYSRETCVLIPHALNIFFIAKRDKELPQGVTAPSAIAHSKNPYKAQVRIESGIKYLGLFPTVEQAFAAYKVEKEAHAKRWADRLERGEFPVDPRVIAALRNWTVPDTK